MSEPRPPTSPLRRIFKVLYWVLSLNLMFSTAVGVTLHVFRDPEGAGPRVPEGTSAESLAGQGCKIDLEGLFHALQKRLHESVAQKAGPEVAYHWQAFTQRWRAELDQVRYRCRLDESGMEALAENARDLEKLRVSYTTAVNGFADTGRGTLDRLLSSFSSASPGMRVYEKDPLE